MMRYIVASPKFWKSVPKNQQMADEVTRYCKEQVPLTKGALTFTSKIEATKKIKGKQLIQETTYQSGIWQYRLLIDQTRAL